jgi:hypothetical protein
MAHVLAKLAVEHHGPEIAVRGGDHARVRRQRLTAADAIELALLEDTEQLRSPAATCRRRETWLTWFTSSASSASDVALVEHTRPWMRTGAML